MLETEPRLGDETQKPEPIPDTELYDLVSSFGNHEAKALTLGLMQPSHIYDTMEAHRLLSLAQKPFDGWYQGIKTSFGYMKYSLAPVGLVAAEITIGDTQKTVGYVKTDKGFRLGDPLAGLLLDFSDRHPDVSLIDLFSLTLSKYSYSENSDGRKKRSPETNVKLFWELLTRQLPARTTDLADPIAENSSVIGSHLDWLSSRGLLEYETINSGAPISYYQLSPILPDRELPKNRYRNSLIRFVFNLLNEDPDKKWTTHDVVESYKEHTRSQASQENIEKKINFALSQLKKTGFAARSVMTTDNKSIVDITNEQRQVLTELVTMLDRFRLQDSQLLEFGRLRLREITSNPQTVAKLMKKAFVHSPNTNIAPRDITTRDIASIIGSSQSLTTEEVRKRLESLQVRRWKRASVSNYLKEMTERGLIERRLVRGRFEYNIRITEAT